MTWPQAISILVSVVGIAIGSFSIGLYYGERWYRLGHCKAVGE